MVKYFEKRSQLRKKALKLSKETNTPISDGLMGSLYKYSSLGEWEREIARMENSRDFSVKILHQWMPASGKKKGTWRDGSIPITIKGSDPRLAKWMRGTYDEEELRNIAKDYMADYAGYEGQRDSWFRGEVDSKDFSIGSILPIDNSDLAKQPLYRSKMSYPALGLWGGESGICGYETLLEEYPKKSGSIEDLEEFFGKSREQGLTVEDFTKFGVHHNVTVHCLNLNGEPVASYLSTNDNRNRDRENHALAIIAANGHVYKLEGKAKIAAINSACNKSKKVLCDILREKKVTEREEEEREAIRLSEPPAIDTDFTQCVDYYVDEYDLTDYYVQFLERGLAYPSKWTNNFVTTIYIENSRVFASPDYEVASEIARDLELKYNNDSLPALVRKAFKKFQADQGKKFGDCYYNRKMKRYLEKDLFKTGPFNYTFSDYEPSKSEVVRGIDQCKQYTHVMMQGNIPDIDVHCGQEKYNGTIEPGFYFVESDKSIADHVPFKGNGFYDYQLVSGLLERGHISESQIKFRLVYQVSKDKDEVLADFLHYLYKMTPHAKKLANPLNGGFACVQSKTNYKNFIVADPVSAGHLYYKQRGTSVATVMQLADSLYRVQSYEEAERFSDNLAVYKAIVDRANLETLKLHDYVRSFGYRILQWKTDCIMYVHNGKKDKMVPVSKTGEIGEYRSEKNVPTVFKKSDPNNRLRISDCAMIMSKWTQNSKHMASETEFYNHNNILEYERVYIAGMAGSGKSYMIDKLKKILGETFGYIAFTHCAANNIDGETAHGFLGIGRDSLSEGRFYDVCKKYKGIIIDEVNMLPLAVYRVLCMLPKEFKIYAFGDHRQELPVKCDASYLDTDMFCDLVDGNMIQLKKQCRADADYANSCIAYHDSGDVKDLQLEVLTEKRELPELNIVWTNKMRKAINKELMGKHRTQDAVFLPYKEQKTFDEDTEDQGQDMLLYVGLPVVARKTIKKGGYHNSEMFVVKGTDGGVVVLETRKLNDYQKIKTLQITLDEFHRNFLPSYAVTTYKIEGATISIPHAIHEFSKMDSKKKYTAMTRTTDKQKITCYA